QGRDVRDPERLAASRDRPVPGAWDEPTSAVRGTMSATRSPRGVAATPARLVTAGRSTRPSGLTSMMALQRSAGNASTLALMRRSRTLTEESPVTFTLPGVVDRVSVSSWSLNGTGGKPAELHITRQSDANSARLAEAMTSGAPG